MPPRATASHREPPRATASHSEPKRYLRHVVVHAGEVGSVNEPHSGRQIDNLLQLAEKIARRLDVMLSQRANNLSRLLGRRLWRGLRTRKDVLDAHETEQHTDALTQTFPRNQQHLLVSLLFSGGRGQGRGVLRIVEHPLLLGVGIVRDFAKPSHQTPQQKLRKGRSETAIVVVVCLVGCRFHRDTGEHGAPIELQTLQLIEQLTQAQACDGRLRMQVHHRCVRQHLVPDAHLKKGHRRVARFRQAAQYAQHMHLIHIATLLQRQRVAIALPQPPLPQTLSCSLRPLPLGQRSIHLLHLSLPAKFGLNFKKKLQKKTSKKNFKKKLQKKTYKKLKIT